MQSMATKTNTVIEQISISGEQKVQDSEYQGSPVYLFRSLFTEMSQLGLDLTVEPFDDIDY